MRLQFVAEILVRAGFAEDSRQPRERGANLSHRAFRR
jgi:hypothetical protein